MFKENINKILTVIYYYILFLKKYGTQKFKQNKVNVNK